jgi:hypothetical protein
MGIFFFELHLEQCYIANAGAPMCLGCLMNHVLENEIDHYKLWKRTILRTWLNTDDGPIDRVFDVEVNTTDLRKAIGDFEDRDIIGGGRLIDSLRARDFHQMGIDREFMEMQVPLSTEEKGRLGYRRRSPDIAEKHNDPKVKYKPGEEMWGWSRADMRNAHGM